MTETPPGWHDSSEPQPTGNDPMTPDAAEPDSVASDPRGPFTSGSFPVAPSPSDSLPSAPPPDYSDLSGSGDAAATMPPPPARAPGGPAGTFTMPSGEYGQPPPPPGQYGEPAQFGGPPPYGQQPPVPGQYAQSPAPGGFEQPMGVPYGSLRDQPTNSPAIISLILGIGAMLCFGFLLGVPGLICGIIGLQKANRTGTGKGLAIAGLILSSLGIAWSGLWIIALIASGG